MPGSVWSTHAARVVTGWPNSYRSTTISSSEMADQRPKKAKASIVMPAKRRPRVTGRGSRRWATSASVVGSHHSTRGAATAPRNAPSELVMTSSMSATR